MELFMSSFVGVSGVCSVIYSQIMHTKNFKSCMIFKVIPLIFGLGNVFVSCKMFGWI